MTYKWRNTRSYRFVSNDNGQTINYESRYNIGSGDNYRALMSAGHRLYGKFFSLSWEDYRNKKGFHIYRNE